LDGLAWGGVERYLIDVFIPAGGITVQDGIAGKRSEQAELESDSLLEAGGLDR
jgi:hypothetical protein